MKRKILLNVLSMACVAATAVGFVNCGDTPSAGTEPSKMEQVYAQYVVYAQAEGIEPLSYEAWLFTIRGEKGDKGDQGEQGIQGEKGDKGDQGEPGKDGVDGEDGKSAYDIWLEAGNEGTYADFIASLKGEKGDKGDQGEDGIDGTGIADVELVCGKLVITYTDGRIEEFDMPVADGTALVHNYGKWLVYEGEGLPCEQRIFYRVCADCNDMEWKKGSSLDHEWADTYSYDKEFHWYACENCKTIKDKETHILDEDAGECSLCYAPMTSTAGVLYDVSADGTYAEVIGYEGSATKVKIADTYEGVPVTGICNNAFYQKHNITSVFIPDSVTSIGNSAFFDCESLTSIVIPDSVTSIGDSAFCWCFSLTSVVIGDSVTSIGNSAFEDCDCLTSVVIPDSVTSIGDEPFGWCDRLTSITVGANNTNYKDIDGNLYSKDGTILIQYAIGKTATSFSIPNSVTSIAYGAFHNCDSLTSVEIPDSVTSIERCAFRYCGNLTNIEIPDSVTSIANEAFDYCDSLTFNTYGNCNYLGSKDNPYYALIKASNQNYSTYTIHEDTKVIADYALSGCSRMTSIVIPDSVTSIGDNAFPYGNSLTSVYYKGTVEEWNELGVEDWAINYATLYYYSESAPTEEGNYWHYDENGEIAVW